MWEHLEQHARSGRAREETSAYLNGLGDAFQSLRRAYSGELIQVDYRDPNVISAYLYGYYPHYVATSHFAFGSVAAEFLQASLGRVNADVLMMGGGPLPEIVGMAERLHECRIYPNRIRATLLDLYADTWYPTTMLSRTLARTMLPRTQFEIVAHQADLCQENSAAIALLPEHINLLMIQNCLNELAASDAFAANLKAIVEHMPNGALIIISDLDRYSAFTRSLDRIVGELGERIRVIVEPARVGPGVTPFGRTRPTFFYDFHRAVRRDDGKYDVPKGFNQRRWLNVSAAVFQRNA